MGFIAKYSVFAIKKWLKSLFPKLFSYVAIFKTRVCKLKFQIKIKFSKLEFQVDKYSHKSYLLK